MRSLLTSENEFEEANVTPQDLRAGVVAIGRGPVKITGEIPTLTGLSDITLDPGYEVTIPKSIIDVPFKVLAKSLAVTTPATAVAEDILEGKTAWVNGSLLTGTRPASQTPSVDSLVSIAFQSSEDPGDTGGSSRLFHFKYQGTGSGDIKVIDVSTDLRAEILMSTFGDADLTEVRKGKKFTSRLSGGLAGVGTLAEWPSRTARCDLDYTYMGTKLWYGYGSSWDSSNEGLKARIAFANNFFAGKNSTIGLIIQGSDLGDAVASDVRKGKTFTSAAGKKVTGTLEADDSGLEQQAIGGETGYILLQVPLAKPDLARAWSVSAGESKTLRGIYHEVSFWFVFIMGSGGGLATGNFQINQISGQQSGQTSVQSESISLPDGTYTSIGSFILPGFQNSEPFEFGIE